jgi:Uma2 family endonuclease
MTAIHTPQGTERPATAPLLVLLAVPREGRWLDAFEAMAKHLQAGAQAVVVLDPRHGTACVYRDDEPPKVLHESDTLTLPDVLPGFSVPVAQFFA